MSLVLPPVSVLYFSCDISADVRYSWIFSGISVASFWMVDLSSGSGEQGRISSSRYFRCIWWNVVFVRNRNMWISLESRPYLQVYISFNVSLILGFLRSSSYYYFLRRGSNTWRDGRVLWKYSQGVELWNFQLINLWDWINTIDQLTRETHAENIEESWTITSVKPRNTDFSINWQNAVLNIPIFHCRQLRMKLCFYKCYLFNIFDFTPV